MIDPMIDIMLACMTLEHWWRALAVVAAAASIVGVVMLDNPLYCGGTGQCLSCRMMHPE
jgi:hypothetical protein